jgi:opacity protein-like surface antigen
MSGIEITAVFPHHSINMRFSNPPFNPPFALLLRTQFKRKSTLIPSAVLGCVLDNRFYVFGKVGLGIAQFKTTIQNPNAGGDTVTQTKKRLGFVPELGIEYAVNQCFSVVATARYEHYKKLTQSATHLLSESARVGELIDTTVVTYRPSFISGRIGIIYKF